VRRLVAKGEGEGVNKSQLARKLLRERERDHQRAEFLQKKLGEDAQKPPYNTARYNTAIVCRLYKAGRTYLVRIPKSVIEELKLQPMDLVTILIKKEEETG
jgi:hypothetical protein